MYACYACACPRSACSMLAMSAPTCWSSDAWACVSTCMHARWQAHPAMPTARHLKSPSLLLAVLARVGLARRGGLYVPCPAPSTLEVALFLGRFRAASAYPGPPDTGAPAEPPLDGLRWSLVYALTTCGAPGMRLPPSCWLSASPTCALPCIATLLPRGTSVVRLHGPGGSRSTP